MATPVRSFADSFPVAKPVRMDDLIDYGDDAIVSRTLARTEAGTLTLFAFSAGQGLSEHTAPFDAFVQVVEGHLELVVDGKKVVAQAGENVLMPASIPHAVNATVNAKMLLFMLKR